MAISFLKNVFTSTFFYHFLSISGDQTPCRVATPRLRNSAVDSVLCRCFPLSESYFGGFLCLMGRATQTARVSWFTYSSLSSLLTVKCFIPWEIIAVGCIKTTLQARHFFAVTLEGSEFSLQARLSVFPLSASSVCAQVQANVVIDVTLIISKNTRESKSEEIVCTASVNKWKQELVMVRPTNPMTYSPFWFDSLLELHSRGGAQRFHQLQRLLHGKCQHPPMRNAGNGNKGTIVCYCFYFVLTFFFNSSFESGFSSSFEFILFKNAETFLEKRKLQFLKCPLGACCSDNWNHIHTKPNKEKLKCLQPCWKSSLSKDLIYFFRPHFTEDEFFQVFLFLKFLNLQVLTI